MNTTFPVGAKLNGSSRLRYVRRAHIERYRQIAGVLVRHGLGHLASILGLERFLPLNRRVIYAPSEAHVSGGARHLRAAFEELGTTFIKLGQVLSTRADLLPLDYQTELARLQDSAPSFPPEAVLKLLTAELARPIEEVFTRFDTVPFASASIGQAHAATLLDGTEVVVKLRRPGVVEQVENDLEILQNLAATAARRWSLADQYDPVGLAQEFAQTLRAELDYIREGRSAERFAANFRGHHGVHIPRVFWDLTTTRMLTLERIQGIKISDLAALDASGIDRPALARRAAGVILKMVFEDGFYHADPHPGNFFIEPGGRIGLIDFGMVGTVSDHTREQLISVMLAVTSQDADRMVDALLALGIAIRRVDRATLRQDIEHLVSRYYGRELGEININELLNDVLAVVRRHHLQLPSNLALLLKTMMMNEGLGLQLDPSFNLARVVAPYAKRMVMRRYSPVVWANRLNKASMDIAWLGLELPQQLRRIASEIEHGGLEVGVRPEGFEPLVRRIERLANRIVLGIIAAAFVNGLAVLLSVYRPFEWEPWGGILFAVGFFASVILGLYLAWSILRSGHK